MTNELTRRLARLEASKAKRARPVITMIEVCHYDLNGVLIVTERRPLGQSYEHGATA